MTDPSAPRAGPTDGGGPDGPPRRVVERRVLTVVAVVAALAAPALALRAFCVGRSCPEPEGPGAQVPYCSLPGDVRRRIAAGFRDGRAPDVLAIVDTTPVRGATGLERLAPVWPGAVPDDAQRVPLVLAGSGVAPGPLPEGIVLDRVAPTIAEIVGLRRPHPGVRSGSPLEGVASGRSPRLVLEVVWKGVGSRDLEAARRDWPVLRSLLRGGAGTLRADAGSLPLDPAAVLTTIGTGGLPRQHGITGTMVRNDAGEVVRAWSRDAPVPVIAALGDDLDEVLRQEPRVGVVGTDPGDRGVVGGTWYLDADRDDVVVTRPGPRRQVRAAGDLLRAGYGADEVPDLLAVVMEGRVADLDAALGELVEVAENASGRSVTVVVTSTGAAEAPAGTTARALRRMVEREIDAPAVAAMAVGGVFLDRDLVGTQGISADRVVRALRGLRADDGGPLLADVFPALAVSFARYC